MKTIRARLIRTKADVVGAWVLAALLICFFIFALAGYKLGFMGLLYLTSLSAGWSLAFFLTRPQRYRKLRAASLVILTFVGWLACGVGRRACTSFSTSAWGVSGEMARRRLGGAR